MLNNFIKKGGERVKTLDEVLSLSLQERFQDKLWEFYASELQADVKETAYFMETQFEYITYAVECSLEEVEYAGHLLIDSIYQEAEDKQLSNTNNIISKVAVLIRQPIKVKRSSTTGKRIIVCRVLIVEINKINKIRFNIITGEDE